MKISASLSAKISNVGLVCATMIVILHVHVTLPSESWQGILHGVMMEIGDGAVPMFFAISGFLFAGHIGEDGWWRREAGKRVRSLMVPYVFWNLFYLLLSVSLTALAGLVGQSFGGVAVSDLTVWKFIGALGLHPLSSPQLPFLWFVRCLIVFSWIAPVFALAKRRGGGGGY